MRENDLIASLRDLLATGDPSVLTGSGPDDCAHIETAGTRLSVSTDAFVEGSHFLPDAPASLVARKAMAASISDLAASACRPRWAVVSLCLKKGLGGEWAAAFARGLAETAAEYGVAIVGGDTVASKTGTFVSMTVIGESLPGGPVLRSGGRPGDALIVTGELGGSLLGRHLRPVARVREITLLMRFCQTLGGEGFFPTALMDISDGLAIDLSRLCGESGTGAIVEADRVPLSPAAREMAAETGRSALEHALRDGEDFELLIAMPPATWNALSAWLDSPAGVAAAGGTAPFIRIGRLTAEAGLRLRAADGSERPLAAEGYEHQW